MAYLQEFRTHIANHDYPAFVRLWEEYSSGDEIDPEELREILKAVKNSEFSDSFGRHVEKILPLWKTLSNSPFSHEIFKLILDIQTTNNENLAAFTYEYLKAKYADDPLFNDRIRLIGLRNKEQFQGAVSNYELLRHMVKGNYVFHVGGWGVGEIIDVSAIREQLVLEFDYVPGRKDLSFSNAFKTLIPIPNDHFLALRFGNPDLLEKKAKENPLEVIRMLLRDLGPKTAAEIKDELCELVIVSKEWLKWWQLARAKVKKDTLIESPEDTKQPFILRQGEVPHEERLQKALENKPDASTLIQMVYSFIKDFSETLKNESFKTNLSSKLTEMLSFEELSDAQRLQIHFFLQDFSGVKSYQPIIDLVKNIQSFIDIINKIEIASFKKRALIEARKIREDWQKIFFELLLIVDQNLLRDYIFSELSSSHAEKQLINKKLEELLLYPARNPEAFLWYFQKMMAHPALPFGDLEGKNRFFESFLILLSHLEQSPTQKDLVKKLQSILTAGRYAIVRQIFQGSSIELCQEFLLLATKCGSFSDHDIKILHSLAEVVHPALDKIRKKKEKPNLESQSIWMTQEGYHKVQQRIHQISTVETIENAKEIEIARSHGDLRENMEFKAAKEKKNRLQAELKTLSDMLNKGRILTKEDIIINEACIGTIIDCQNSQGKKISYTVLGPVEADSDKNILSYQSKLAQKMLGLKVGDKFEFQGDIHTVILLRSYLDYVNTPS